MHDCDCLLQPKMAYTESQVRDLLHLRRLYYGKMGQLYRQRKELRAQVPLACMGEVENICATDNYTLLSNLAEKLRQNAAEEYSVFVQSFCAIFRGVSCIAHDTLRRQRSLCFLS